MRTRYPDEVMSPAEFEVRFRRLVEAMRERCLWHLKADYLPDDLPGRMVVLTAIQNRADLKSFQEAGVLKAWLSRSSSTTSAGSSPSGAG